MIADTKVLILEDNDSDADLLCRELKKSGLSFSAKIVQTKSDYETAIKEFNPDIILSDYSLPSFDAVSAFKIKQLHLPLIPFIIVSGTIGEENAVDLINSGVTDHVSKSKLFSLPTKFSRALTDFSIRKEKHIADEKTITQAAELIIANKDLRILSDNLKIQQMELLSANTQLISQEEKVVRINKELSQLNQELEDRVVRRTKLLVESEARFRNMMEAIPQIAWTNTIAGEVEFFNQRWYGFTGLDRVKDGTGGIKFVAHPDDLKNVLKQFSLIRHTDEGGEFQTRIKRADGHYRWHLIRFMPIKNEVGQSQLWAGTATDIQELIILQQQKDDFISIASHELKTPITSLKASLQLLEKMKDKPSSSMLPVLITQANKSLTKVNVLIEDLLNASKANEGQLHINPSRFILYEVIKDCSQYLNDDNYSISVKGDLETQVYADPARIEQVVLNFINNAVKYAPKSKEIDINIIRLGGMVKVTVTDKGAGIALQNLGLLFDRYYRIDESGSTYSGLGLGLYICSEIIKKHHGKIGVESELGRGSSFWFTLPI